MRKYLLPEQGNFYKANLHCHSTISDGKYSPAELKEIYKNMGYSVLAYTDHKAILSHNELTDDKFLALNGVELDIYENTPGKSWHDSSLCHVCFIALDENNLLHPYWSDGLLLDKNIPDLVRVERDGEQNDYTYNVEAINKMIGDGRKKGYFVTYNHPSWSKETYAEYSQYDGMHAFEMFNGGCLAAGFEDYNPRVYDDFLMQGKKIYCIGADDNHNFEPLDSRSTDSGVAFTMIKADKLDYKTVTNALLDGSFYCSEGPEIYELYHENGKIHIKCSDADRITCTYGCRKAGIAYAEKDGVINSASFEVNNGDSYVRLTVIDKRGNHACTNAYFID